MQFILSNIWTTLVIGVSLCFLYNVGLVIYRLYFHPLRNFPGPKLNAATLWVDFYYEVVLKGQMLFKLKEWHDQYGMSYSWVLGTDLMHVPKGRSSG